MSILLSRILRSPRLSRVLLALSLPCLVTIGFAPVWAIALSVITLLLAVVFMYAEVLSPKFIQKNPNAPKPQALPKAKALAQLPALPVSSEPSIGEKISNAKSNHSSNHQLLAPWMTFGKEASSTLTYAQTEIREAIRMAGSSAVEVGHCIQQIQVNHTEQMQLASKLLAGTESGSDHHRTLADLAGLAAEALEHQSKQMALTADNAFYLVERQQMASLIALRVDDLLAEADKAARELAIAALSSEERNALDEHQPRVDPLTFSKTYRNTIRELRSGLDAIRQSLAQATNDLQNNVNQLKGAANLGRAEVDSVAIAIQSKLSESQASMKRLSEISVDTDNHIRNAVVAMQYHDITTQKLASVESGKLQELLTKTETLITGTQDANLAPATPPSASETNERFSKLYEEISAPLANAAEEELAPLERKLSHNELADAALAELEKHVVVDVKPKNQAVQQSSVQIFL